MKKQTTETYAAAIAGSDMLTTRRFMELKNCMDCPNHKVLPDPDFDDWFCDDDEKVVCTLANRNITVACRPYKKREECEIQEWCPLATACC